MRSELVNDRLRRAYFVLLDASRVGGAMHESQRMNFNAPPPIIHICYMPVHRGRYDEEGYRD